MDIQFIPEEEREGIFVIMRVCGVDMDQAYQLYINNQNNIEAAIQNNPFLGSFHEEEYKKFKQQKIDMIPFCSRYQIRRTTHTLYSSIKRLFGFHEVAAFKNQLGQYLSKDVSINFRDCTLTEFFQQAQKHKFLLGIFIISFDQRSKEKMNAIWDNKAFMTILKDSLKVYILNANFPNLQRCLQKFFNLERDKDCLIICRVNTFDKIQVVGKINLMKLNISQIIENVKINRSLCIQRQLDQTNLEVQYQEQKQGNMHYKRPKSFQEIARDKVLEQQKQKQMIQKQKQNNYIEIQLKESKDQIHKLIQQQQIMQQIIISNLIQRSQPQAIPLFKDRARGQQVIKVRQQIVEEVIEVRQQQEQEVIEVKQQNEEEVIEVTDLKEIPHKKIKLEIKLPSNQIIEINVSQKEPTIVLFEYKHLKDENILLRQNSLKQVQITHQCEKLTHVDKKIQKITAILSESEAVSLEIVKIIE